MMMRGTDSDTMVMMMVMVMVVVARTLMKTRGNGS